MSLLTSRPKRNLKYLEEEWPCGSRNIFYYKMHLFYYHIQKKIPEIQFYVSHSLNILIISLPSGFYFEISFCCAIVQKNKPMFSGVDVLIHIYLLGF